MSNPEKGIHSTGRGGAGNIGKEEGTYTAGDITREGPLGASGRAGTPDYSTGRGGSANIIHDSRTGEPLGNSSGSVPAPSHDVIPEPAMKAGEQYEDFHTGRGGEGNIHREKYGGHSKPPKERREGVLEKVKGVVGLGKKEG